MERDGEMFPGKNSRSLKLIAASLLTLAIVMLSACASGELEVGRFQGRRLDQLEDLERGLVAAIVPEGVFLSWRLLKEEAFGISKNGLTGFDFDVYRDGEEIATVTDSTNYLDA